MVEHNGTSFKVLDLHTHFAGDVFRFDPIITRIFIAQARKQKFRVGEIGRDPGELVEYLDRAGVDLVCVLAEEGPPTNYSVDSGFCAGYAQQAPDRIIAIGNINPRLHPDSGRRCRQLIRAGVRGFKFYFADHNQDPYDRRLEAVYELCDENRLPILIHTGVHSRYPMSNDRFGDPAFLEGLVARYPQAPFVLCHGGRGGKEQACLELLRYKNVFIETADMIPAELERMCTDDVADRFLFGTDMPQFEDYAPLIDRVLTLPITSANKQKVLYENSAKLLNVQTPTTHSVHESLDSKR